MNHPVGMYLGFFLIVVIFLAVLGVTIAVGHLREQRRKRRADTHLQGGQRDYPPTRRYPPPGRPGGGYRRASG